ncbi:alpha/beta fold hydrolase [Cellulomonas sp. PS-H5]|uniref:GNAT family N-acetyltransferase n=1 Tax=Cellulomonas sp. PS-H5 TaxID=2820400 RepID=UPI001C4E38E4|nr:alpha/beta hydrolase [Cellulomonas sp. PS-H5]MBW0252619.1 alpha/beta hydrolase [Cellulomonas sp. PS-H5]
MTTTSTDAAERHSVTLPNGRVLTGRTRGPADGRAVLLVGGAATGSAMGFGEDLLEPRGVRLITVDRAGMGGSTPDPGRTAASTARDHIAFAAAVGHPEPLPVVTNSQGSVFGLALAAAGAASRLVLVSPADEVAHPDVAPLLPPHARELADLARADPEAARAVLGRLGPAEMEAMVRNGAEAVDRAVYERPAFLARWRAALVEGFAGQGAAYVQDTLLAMRPWHVDLSAVAVPTTVVVGEHDRGHSPDRARMLTARVPGAVRRVVPGAGGSLLWARPELVLDAALGAPDRDALARAAHAETWQTHGRIRAGRGGAVADLPGIRLMASGLAHPWWNNGDVTDPDRVELGEVRDWYARRGVPWGVRVPAGVTWPHGRHLFRKRLMLLDARALVTQPPVPGLGIRRATAADLDAVLAVDLAAFGGEPAASRAWLDPLLGSPVVTVALAELDGAPVGTAYVVRSDGEAGPAVGLGGVGVVPAARRRGVAAAVSSWVLAGAVDAGAGVAHTEPDTDGAARLYTRLGFAEVGGLDVYVDLA